MRRIYFSLLLALLFCVFACAEVPGKNWTQQYLVLLRQQAEGQYPAVPFIRILSLLLLLLVLVLCVSLCVCVEGMHGCVHLLTVFLSDSFKMT